ncbi:MULTISPECIES: hypothetical protein [Acinetobacter]|nr:MULTISPECIES: hypothetical protein [Acinetobacter]
MGEFIDATCGEYAHLDGTQLEYDDFERVNLAVNRLLKTLKIKG